MEILNLIALENEKIHMEIERRRRSRMEKSIGFLRRLAGYSAEQMAHALSISRPMLSYCETGKRQISDKIYEACIQWLYEVSHNTSTEYMLFLSSVYESFTSESWDLNREAVWEYIMETKKTTFDQTGKIENEKFTLEDETNIKNLVVAYDYSNLLSNNSLYAKDHTLDELLSVMNRIIDFFKEMAQYEGIKESFLRVYAKLFNYLLCVKHLEYEDFYSIKLIDLPNIMFNLCKYQRVKRCFFENDEYSIELANIDQLEEKEILDKDCILTLKYLSYLYIDIREHCEQELYGIQEHDLSDAQCNPIVYSDRYL